MEFDQNRPPILDHSISRRGVLKKAGAIFFTTKIAHNLSENPIITTTQAASFTGKYPTNNGEEIAVNEDDGEYDKLIQDVSPAIGLMVGVIGGGLLANEIENPNGGNGCLVIPIIGLSPIVGAVGGYIVGQELTKKPHKREKPKKRTTDIG